MLFNVEKFRYWCHKILPLVYDDSLSYMELLSKVVKKLNECIDAIAAQNQEIQDFEAAVDAEIERFEREAVEVIIQRLQPWQREVEAEIEARYQDAVDYADAKLVEAKAYSDAGDASTLATAKSYADTKDATTLASAKSYTDNKITSTLAGDVEIGGDLTVQRQTDLKDHLSVDGSINLAGDVNAGAHVVAHDGISVTNGDMSVSGDVSVGNDVDIDGALRVDGGIHSDSSITSDGNISVGNNLTVDENASVVGDLTVGGDLTVTGSYPLPPTYIKSASIASGKTTLVKQDDSEVILNVGNGSQAHSVKSSGAGQVTAEYATAFGNGTQGTGKYAFAAGVGSVAGDSNHLAATAIGQYVRSVNGATGRFACGAYNLDNTGTLFEVGNGTSTTVRANAFEIDGSGNGKFNNNLTVSGYTNIDHILTVDDHISSTSQLDVTNNNTQYFKVDNHGDCTIAHDTSVGGSLTVSGASTFNDRINVNDTAIVVRNGNTNKVTINNNGEIIVNGHTMIPTQVSIGGVTYWILAEEEVTP